MNCPFSKQALWWHLLDKSFWIWSEGMISCLQLAKDQAGKEGLQMTALENHEQIFGEANICISKLH